MWTPLVMGIVELIVVGRWGRLGVKNVAKYSAACTGQANWQNTSPPEGLNYGLERLQKIPDLRNSQLKPVESMFLSKNTIVVTFQTKGAWS